MRDVHTERARRARAIAAELEERGLDQAPFELGDGAVVAGRRLGRAWRWNGGERRRCRHAIRYRKARATPRSRTFRGDDDAGSRALHRRLCTHGTPLPAAMGMRATQSRGGRIET